MSREKQIELLEKQLAFWKHHSTQLAEELDKEEKIANHYAEMLDKTEEELNAERVEREWISVDERLPDGNGRFLTVDKEGRMEVCYWEKRFGWFASSCNKNALTHWMPLPEAPRMKGGAE